MPGLTDWVGLATGGVQTAYTWSSFNQNAYLNNCQMAQAQQYQQKNYHLGWVGVAREDIRDLMNTSVTRINNYMLVATLILGVAASALTGTELPTDCPPFILHAFWLNMGVSIAYFSLSIMFAVKGQNSAFLNTMRLLTWEVRPENPARYDHNYMTQAQQFERDGLRGLFRVPGLRPDYHPWDPSQSAQAGPVPSAGAPAPDAGASFAPPPVSKGMRRSESAAYHNYQGQSSSSSSSGAASMSSWIPKRPAAEGLLGAAGGPPDAPLERIEPPTRQLLYLARFSRFMQIWQPFDTHAKYCIGIGLISLAKGSAYFSLGMLYGKKTFMSNVTGISMMLIFVGVVVMIYEQSFKVKQTAERVSVYCLFLGGPFCGALAAVNQARWIRMVFAPGCFMFHGMLYGACFILTLIETRDPSEITKKYIRGPDGQEFSQNGGDPRLPEDIELAEEMASRDSANTVTEEETARRVQEKVSHTVRVALLMTAILWILLALVTLGEEVVRDRPKVTVKVPVTYSEVPVSWPSGLSDLRALSCSKGAAFLANEYQVFRLPLSSGVTAAPSFYPCNLSRPVADVATDCDGSACRVMALLGGSPSTLVDCDSQEEFPILQEPIPAERVTFIPREPGQARGSLVALHGEKAVEYSFTGAGWSPLWRRGNTTALMAEALDEDCDPDRQVGLGVGRLYAFSPALITVLALDGSKVPEHWSLYGAPRPSAACALDDVTTLALAEGAPPKLLRITTPR